MVTVDKLSKDFGRVSVVRNVSFTLQPREVLGLIGPNGAGKTTLLRCITGILQADHGKVTVFGKSLTESPEEVKKEIAYLSDYPKFFETLTCWDHVRFIASLYSVPDYESKAKELFHAFGLTARKDSFPDELSHGMRQSLSLTLGFMREPKVLIFDEPVTALDPVGIHVFNDLIKTHADRGACVLLSSHLLSLLEKVSTRILIMNRGLVQACDSRDMALEEFFLRTTNRENDVRRPH